MRAPGRPKSVRLNDGANAPSTKPSPGVRKGPWVPWTAEERDTVWRHPDMTAAELHELVPRHSPKAIARMRDREGRWRPRGVTPLCQRCGQHPVNTADPEARRWGLCRECAQAEKDWRDRNDERLRRENDARRQRRHKRGGRGA